MPTKNYNKKMLAMGSTGSDKVIIHLYSIRRAIIPSSGIMSSHGDRNNSNPRET
jgi:hypothetical protein